jgi:hypothetical protein
VSRWIVSNIPPWMLLLGLIVLIVGGSLLALKFVRRRFPGRKGDERSEVTQFAFMFVGFVYAFFVGFVVSSMWGQINTADDEVGAEGATAVQMAMDLTVFDKSDSDRIRQSLLEYANAAVSEWPIAARGDSLPEAQKALERLRTAYEKVQASSDTQKTFLAGSFDSLKEISHARTKRILRASTDIGPPWSLWSVFLLTSGLVLGCVIIFSVEKPLIHYTLVAIVAVLIAANLFLVLELAHPYIGEIGASPDPLRAVIQVLSAPQT